jgi:hypothetical protein
MLVMIQRTWPKRTASGLRSSLVILRDFIGTAREKEYAMNFDEAIAAHIKWKVRLTQFIDSTGSEKLQSATSAKMTFATSASGSMATPSSTCPSTRTC